MKIQHILYSGLGGHGNVFFSLVKADHKREFEYEALFNGIEQVKPEYRENCAHHDIPWDFIPKKPGLDLKYYARFIRKIRNSTANIVFLHSSAYIFPARMANLSGRKKKIIVRETQANHLKSKMEWLWLGVAMVLADQIVFLSEEYRQEIAKRLKFLYRPKKIKVIPNGLDLKIYKPLKKEPSPVIVLGMQSRLVRIKDHSTLLKAFAMIVSLFKKRGISVELRIAGEGDNMTELLKERASLQLEKEVIFTGMLPESELVFFLQSLDIYIHASLGETMSTAIMQAMACGLPVVASDVSGINNMIKNGETGLLVPPKETVELFEVLERIINDANERKRLGNAALQYAEKNFSSELMFKRYKGIF